MYIAISLSSYPPPPPTTLNAGGNIYKTSNKTIASNKDF